MIKNLIPFFSKAINRYLRLDPNLMTQLQTLNGKLLAVQLTDRQVTLFMLIKADAVELMTETDQIPHADVAGRTLVLWQMLRSSKIHDDEVVVKGDIELIQKIKSIFSNIDIDWEEQVSRYTGDVVAHQFMLGAKSVKNWLQKTRRNVHATVTEYLQEEKRILVSPYEVEEFFSNVATLRNDVERAEARLNRLLQVSAGKA